MEKWLQELLDIGMGRIAIKQLALLQAGAVNQLTKCPRCGTQIKKWAVGCPKCRMRLP